ncbi:MAG: hypothetical protein ACHREM_04715 [Polyangiales bacterium]
MGTAEFRECKYIVPTLRLTFVEDEHEGPKIEMTSTLGGRPWRWVLSLGNADYMIRILRRRAAEKKSVTLVCHDGDLAISPEAAETLSFDLAGMLMTHARTAWDPRSWDPVPR